MQGPPIGTAPSRLVQACLGPRNFERLGAFALLRRLTSTVDCAFLILRDTLPPKALGGPRLRALPGPLPGGQRSSQTNKASNRNGATVPVQLPVPATAPSLRGHGGSSPPSPLSNTRNFGNMLNIHTLALAQDAS